MLKPGKQLPSINGRMYSKEKAVDSSYYECIVMLVTFVALFSLRIVND